MISTSRRRYGHHDRPARRVCRRTVLKIDSKTSLERKAENHQEQLVLVREAAEKLVVVVSMSSA